MAPKALRLADLSGNQANEYGERLGAGLARTFECEYLNDDTDFCRLMAIPECFNCPLSLSPMRNPVATCDGQLYERDQIEQWIRRCNQDRRPITSPVTGLELSHTILFPALALQKAIEVYLENRPELKNAYSTGRSFEEAARALQEKVFEKQGSNDDLLAEVLELKRKLFESEETVAQLTQEVDRLCKQSEADVRTEYVTQQHAESFDEDPRGDMADAGIVSRRKFVLQVAMPVVALVGFICILLAPYAWQMYSGHVVPQFVQAIYIWSSVGVSAHEPPRSSSDMVLSPEAQRTSDTQMYEVSWTSGQVANPQQQGLAASMPSGQIPLEQKWETAIGSNDPAKIQAYLVSVHQTSQKHVSSVKRNQIATHVDREIANLQSVSELTQIEAAYRLGCLANMSRVKASPSIQPLVLAVKDNGLAAGAAALSLSALTSGAYNSKILEAGAVEPLLKQTQQRSGQIMYARINALKTLRRLVLAYGTDETSIKSIAAASKETIVSAGGIPVLMELMNVNSSTMASGIVNEAVKLLGSIMAHEQRHASLCRHAGVIEPLLKLLKWRRSRSRDRTEFNKAYVIGTLNLLATFDADAARAIVRQGGVVALLEVLRRSDSVELAIAHKRFQDPEDLIVAEVEENVALQALAALHQLAAYDRGPEEMETVVFDIFFEKKIFY